MLSRVSAFCYHPDVVCRALISEPPKRCACLATTCEGHWQLEGTTPPFTLLGVIKLAFLRLCDPARTRLIPLSQYVRAAATLATPPNHPCEIELELEFEPVRSAWANDSPGFTKLEPFLVQYVLLSQPLNTEFNEPQI